MKLSLFIALACFSALFAHGQCGYDTITGGGSGVGDIDSMVMSMPVPRCPQCDTSWNATACWELPQDFNGDVCLYSPTPGNFHEIQITTGCDYLLFDTCGTFPPNTASGQFRFFFRVIGSVQLCVLGHEGDTVILIAKSTPIPQDELSDTIRNLDTCGMALSVMEPVNQGYEYRRWGDGSLAEPPLAPGYYIRRDPLYISRNRIILVK